MSDKKPPSQTLDGPVNASVRLAKNKDEIQKAQELRFQVFYEEYGAEPSPEILKAKMDFDDFDDITDHLVVIVDEGLKTEKIVGTYRLLRHEEAVKFGRFYSSAEYDLEPLLQSGENLLELGRSCVLAEYRTRPVLNLLWQGIAAFIMDHDFNLLFGCASFHTTNVDEIAAQLSYLHHFHSCNKEISPVALPDLKIDMDIIPKKQLDPRLMLSSLPPLIKGYIRLGATIGEGAVIDKEFGTTDVCIVVQTSLMTERYKKHYERIMRRAMPKSAKDNNE